jgi:Cysteine-rich secretory protein family
MSGSLEPARVGTRDTNSTIGGDGTVLSLSSQRCAGGSLTRAGTRYARDMVRRSFFSHTSPDRADMVDRLRAVGYALDDRVWTIGETLTWGTGARATPTATVDAWLKSRPHPRILLDRGYHDVGVGVQVGVPVGGRVHGATATYAAEFGVRP